MSSLFSDPPFPRGATLLAGETIALDAAGNPVAGQEVIGQIKAFQDVSPGTGPASVRYSNRLVYCVAARYVGTANLNVDGADKGKLYTLARRNGLAAFDGTVAAATDVTDGRTVGVLDEYLNTTVRPNDIVWIVVKGPASAAKGATVVVPGGLGFEAASGLAVTKATQANLLGQAIDAARPYTGTASNASTALVVTDGDGIVAGMPVTGTGIAAGAYVASVSGTAVTLSANTTGAITAGTVFIGGALRTATSCRVNLIGASI